MRRPHRSRVKGATTMKRILLAASLILAGSLALAENQLGGIRPDTPLDEESQADQIPNVINSDVKQVRNYPDQPPVIPHKIDNYQIDLNANKCLTCHSRTAVDVSQAPMISVTHFMDRDGQTLASVSPRRYFCTQCHVVQHDAKPVVVNDFVDVDRVLDFVRGKQGGGQ
jgi:nitrate reductase (cytochrome), electron transfer subunit